eukprot:523427-Karenia_brevis.AAC.1
MVLARGWRKPALPAVQKRINRCIGFSPGRLRALGRQYVWKDVHKAITGKTIRRDLALGFLINRPRKQCPAYTYGHKDVDPNIRFRSGKQIFEILKKQTFGLECGYKKVSAASKASPIAVRLQLGGSFGFGSGFVVSTHSRMCPNLTKALFQFLSSAIPAAKATSIAINDSAITPLHTDRNNIGPTYVMSLGNFYHGGRLWLQCGHDEYKLVNTFEKFFEFNANVPHLTEPFVGRRITITYYTDGRILERQGVAERLQQLALLGAPVPNIHTLRQWKKNAITHKEQNKLLEAAEASSSEFLKSHKGKGNCPLTVCWDCRRRFPMSHAKLFCGVCDVSSVYQANRRVKFR